MILKGINDRSEIEGYSIIKQYKYLGEKEGYIINDKCNNRLKK